MERKIIMVEQPKFVPRTEGLAQGYLAEIIKQQPKNLGYLESANSDPYLNGLARAAEYKKLYLEDVPIRDATDQLLIAAQGPKAFTYLSPELTSALRVSNAVNTKDAMRLTGVPTKEEIKNAAASAEAMDRLKWKVTGNGLKINAWDNSYSSD